MRPLVGMPFDLCSEGQSVGQLYLVFEHVGTLSPPVMFAEHEIHLLVCMSQVGSPSALVAPLRILAESADRFWVRLILDLVRPLS